MKKLLVSLALALSISTVILAGDSHQPGAPAPPPKSCPEGEACTGSNSAVFVIWINGVPFIVTF